MPQTKRIATVWSKEMANRVAEAWMKDGCTEVYVQEMSGSETTTYYELRANEPPG